MTAQFDVIIIGAGAAGLMCAATSASHGKSTLVIDHANKMAKKVLMSGGGRCNFTNLYVSADNFISNNSHFCKSALSRFTQWDFIALVEKYQIPYFEKEQGQLFCENSSKDIRDLLQSECQLAGAKIQLRCQLESVFFDNDMYHLQTSLGLYLAKSLVIATGGLSIPTLGATGLGYQIAQQFGHQVFPTRAGLTPLTFKGKLVQAFIKLAGNAFDALVTCQDHSFKGGVLFTHKGLSGPAILQISNYWTPGSPISIRFLPEIELESWLEQAFENRSDLKLKNLLSQHLSNAISIFIVKHLDLDKKLKQLTHKERQQIVAFLMDWQIYPEDVEGYKVAEVTLGGVDTSQISSKTFESQLQANLYFIGEVLDVTGHLGGFNFQWAWASGKAAGEAIGGSV